jgi:hypothetical protein
VVVHGGGASGDARKVGDAERWRGALEAAKRGPLGVAVVAVMRNLVLLPSLVLEVAGVARQQGPDDVYLLVEEANGPTGGGATQIWAHLARYRSEAWNIA